MDVFSLLHKWSHMLQCDQVKQQYLQCIHSNTNNSQSSCYSMFKHSIEDKCGSRGGAAAPAIIHTDTRDTRDTRDTKQSSSS
jgi:hypothetical protein